MMRRPKLILAALTVLATIAAGLPGSPAQAAYPTTRFLVSASYSTASGTITWYNRSVGIQGYVQDHNSSPDGYSQVRFHWFLDYDTEYGVSQTRTANPGERKSFNFQQQGPEGGIRIVHIRVCALVGGCASDSFPRPQ
ncbi:hypothetical protein M1L60_32155 [Actinoplanes sp. TRM 88003]|uniref:Secreted protein n=1 Tax=Paractinoplanes aksuensis TaxID=2939490 RepID=A0ABT1DZA8_9ACTN|nr:hypothetical protein [Actinoplanes aksuensis]MCO8275245.1 hypothetical protein [Actinoplanes aksuensis]